MHQIINRFTPILQSDSSLLVMHPTTVKLEHTETTANTKIGQGSCQKIKKKKIKIRHCIRVENIFPCQLNDVLVRSFAHLQLRKAAKSVII